MHKYWSLRLLIFREAHLYCSTDTHLTSTKCVNFLAFGSCHQVTNSRPSISHQQNYWWTRIRTKPTWEAHCCWCWSKNIHTHCSLRLIRFLFILLINVYIIWSLLSTCRENYMWSWKYLVLLIRYLKNISMACMFRASILSYLKFCFHLMLVSYSTLGSISAGALVVRKFMVCLIINFQLLWSGCNLTSNFQWITSES